MTKLPTLSSIVKRTLGAVCALIIVALWADVLEIRTVISSGTPNTTLAIIAVIIIGMFAANRETD